MKKTKKKTKLAAVKPMAPTEPAEEKTGVALLIDFCEEQGWCIHESAFHLSQAVTAAIYAISDLDHDEEQESES